MMNLLEQTPEQLKAWFVEQGLPGYRAAQVWRWVFGRRAATFDEMTDLPKSLRTELAEQCTLFTTRIAKHRIAEDGTEKLLLELADGQQTECVLLRNERRYLTICISTQVGCAMECAFCASGLDGLVRNLSSAEIIEQMLQLQRLLTTEERLSNIVVMGMGEPLANLDGLLPALRTATSPSGLGIGARKVTISTVGLPAGIRRLGEHNRQYHLAVSLHAPDDEVRGELIPANRKVGIEALLSAADDYFEITGRRITYEYVLLRGLNDQPEQARRLVALLKGRPAMVNLIPYNPVPDLPYDTPTLEVTTEFAEVLFNGGLNVRTRYRKGDRIDAACGQLRRGR